jgi:hypothetical protein
VYVAASMLLLGGASLLWVALKGGAWLDESSASLTSRGVLATSRVNVCEVDEVFVSTRHDGWYPGGSVRGRRTIPLRGVLGPHTRSVRRQGRCATCDAESRILTDVAAALKVPVVEDPQLRP